jgi:CPA2 family monovalent cation:H+ antiporter-2
LKASGLAHAKVLVIAIDNKSDAVKLVRYAKRQRPDLSVVARANDLHHVFELYEAGADHIVREMFDSSLRAGRYVLEDMGMTDTEAHELEVAFYRNDRHNLAELAEVWKPGVAITENADYMRLTREMSDNLESAMAIQLEALADEADSDVRVNRQSRGDVSALTGISRGHKTPAKTAGRTHRRPGGSPERAK